MTERRQQFDNYGIHVYKDTKTVVTHVIILCNESACIFDIEITSFKEQVHKQLPPTNQSLTAPNRIISNTTIHVYVLACDRPHVHVCHSHGHGKQGRMQRMCRCVATITSEGCGHLHRERETERGGRTKRLSC